MKKLLVVFVLFTCNTLLSQNPLHDTILEQPYRDDTITADFFDIETINAIMFELINEYRVENGLAPCKIDTSLMRLANNHAEWMATTGIYCHISDKRVPNHTDHRKYNFSENITRATTIQWITHYSIAAWAVGVWIWSPAHRNNILDPYAKYIGVGSFYRMTEKGQHEPYFVVQFRKYQ
jgi:uncharacterized protein YkwD